MKHTINSSPNINMREIKIKIAYNYKIIEFYILIIYHSHLVFRMKTLNQTTVFYCSKLKILLDDEKRY